MKRFHAIEYTFSLVATPAGASVGRGLIERQVVLPDSSLMVIWWLLVILDWLAGGISRWMAWAIDWLFIGWSDDLKLIGAAIRGFVPQAQAI